MKRLAALAIAVSIATPALADCDGSYLMGLLGSVMNDCKELRVTGQAIVLAKTMKDKREAADCKDKATDKIKMQMMQTAIQADGDKSETIRLWCDSARTALEASFPDLTLVERR